MKSKGKKNPIPPPIPEIRPDGALPILIGFVIGFTAGAFVALMIALP